MKLRITGNIADTGRYAVIDDTWDDLQERLGKRCIVGTPDYAITLEALEPRRIVFRFIRYETVDTLSIRVGESYEYHTAGNAFEFKVRFALEE